MTSKKNLTMRAAVLMLALVLISSCFVGGTFAKYTTSGNGTDTARVAKFGVEITVNDSGLFKTAYDADTTAGTIQQTVQSSDASKLVAPGTSGEGTSSFSVKGTPEVAVKVEMAMTVNSDVFLKEGSYKDYTKAPYTGNFAVGADYYPVKFTLKQNGTEVKTGKLADIADYLDKASAEYEPGTNLATEIGSYTLSWAWDFDDNGNGTNDKADTLLGNLAADDAKYKADGKYSNNAFTDIDDNDFSTDINFDLTLTVTQID